MCTKKEKGGLGVKSLSELNKALLYKWNWHFANEREALWRRVISWKFGENFGVWCSGDLRGGFGMDLWKEIRKKWVTPHSSACLGVGGNRLRFWEDVWSREDGLQVTFPTLYELAAHKEVSVADLRDSIFGGGGWSLCFARDFNEWEVEG